MLKIVDPYAVIPVLRERVPAVFNNTYHPSKLPPVVTPIVARDYATSARPVEPPFVPSGYDGTYSPFIPTPPSRHAPLFNPPPSSPFIATPPYMPTPSVCVRPLTPPDAQPSNVRNDVPWYYCPPAPVSPQLPCIPSPPVVPPTPPMPAASIPVLDPIVVSTPSPQAEFQRFSQVWNPGFSKSQAQVDFERRPFADPFGDPEPPIITAAEARASLLDASLHEYLKGSEVPEFDYHEHVHEEEYERSRSRVDDEAERVYRAALAEVEKEMERKRAEERRKDKGKRRMTQEEVRKLFAYDDAEDTDRNDDDERKETKRMTKEEVRRLFEQVPLPELSSPKISTPGGLPPSAPQTPPAFDSGRYAQSPFEDSQETQKPEWSLPPIESVASSMSFSDLVRERRECELFDFADLVREGRDSERAAEERTFPSVPVEEPVIKDESLVLPVEARTIEPESVQEEDVVLAAPPVMLKRQSRVARTASSLFDIAPLLRSPTDTTPELVATFISNNNVEDGHVFPPGAEFVKSWLMANEGPGTWPETTELVYVAGYRMGSFEEAPMRYHVGAVPAGGRVDAIAADMKAPEVPGRYIGFWRLSDGLGNFFGHRVWCE